MPLFYLRPFDFHPERRKRRPRLIEFEMEGVLLYIVIGVVGLAFFAAFIVMPALAVLGQSVP